MFGKRGSGATPSSSVKPVPRPIDKKPVPSTGGFVDSSSTAGRALDELESVTTPKKQAPAMAPAKPDLSDDVAAMLPEQRSEEYYKIKTTIFNALIDTINLAQLAQLDPTAAAEEIRDIVNAIISIKNVV